ncbi:MAG: hypothetical protein KDD44_01330 [Bdellovibrionales bacterium]|nr:hypothetical protein [Bdellovibrionales bacterium]
MSQQTRHSQETSEEVIPVPAHLRTARTGPRLIAVLLVISWAIIYYLGTQALARHYTTSTSLVDNTLRAGEHRWVILPKDAEPLCLGYIESNLKTEPTPALSFSGAVVFLLFDEPVKTWFGVTADFSHTSALQTVFFEVRAGKIKIIGAPQAVDKTTIDVQFITSKNQQALSFRRPDPIYLVERVPSVFTLRFPTNSLPQALPALPVIFGPHTDSPLVLEPASADDVVRCKEFLNNAQPSELVTKDVIDVGDMLRPLGFSKHSAGLDELHYTGNERGDN